MLQFPRSLSTTITSPSVARAANSAPVITNLSPTITKVQLVPSFPIYIAKGALLSVYSSNVQGLNISNHYLHPLRRIVNGFHRFRFEKLESTVPSTLLISASLKNKSSSHILTLDGTKDWAVLPRDAILAYSGLSLRIETQLLPRIINKRLKWYQFQSKIKTGLQGPLRPGYSLITGRGDLVLKGEGELYTVELKQDEEFLIKRGNVVGISINGDLAESTEEYQLKKFIEQDGLKQEEEKEKEIVADEETTDIVEKKQDPLKQLKDIWKSITLNTTKFIKYVNDSLPSNDEYVKILGPRTVIIKSQIAQPNFLQLKEDESVLKKD